MKILKTLGILALTLSIGIFFSACGEFTSSEGHEEHSEEQVEQAESHDHEGEHGHDHAHDGDHSHAAAHGEGKAYTSAFVCPMHCEGSGSEEAGKCPVCSMDYVAQAEHVADGHTHE